MKFCVLAVQNGGNKYAYGPYNSFAEAVKATPFKGIEREVHIMPLNKLKNYGESIGLIKIYERDFR